MNNEIFTLWIGPPNELMTLCINSWMNLGYNLLLYCDDDNEEELYRLFYNHKDKIKIKNHTIVPFNDEITNIQAQSDIWRFKYLYLFGGTWLDADMYLLKRLPNEPNIISSEHTCQTGAYKTVGYTKIPNIGVLRLPSSHPLMEKSLKQTIKWNDKSRCNKFMLKYQKILRANEEWMKYVAEPDVYCPVSWCNAKELYYGNIIKSDKYGIKQLGKFDIINDSIGVHLWNNFTYNKHKINFNKIHPGSLFNELREWSKLKEGHGVSIIKENVLVDWK